MIGLDGIKQLAGTDKNFKNAKEYYNAGLVEILGGSKDMPHGEIVYSGEAYGTRKYEFEIWDYGSRVTYQCTCPASTTYSHRACKHVVAALLEIHYNKENLDVFDNVSDDEFDDVEFSFPFDEEEVQISEPKLNSMKNELKKALERFENLNEGKKELKVEYILKPYQWGFGEPSYEIQLKIGIEKTYVMKKITEFYEEYIEDPKATKINKSLTIDWEIYRLSEKDEKNIKNIYELIIIPRSISDGWYDYVTRLKGSMVEMFLKGFQGELIINEETFKVGEPRDIDLLIRDNDGYKINPFSYISKNYIVSRDTIVEVQEEQRDLVKILNKIQIGEYKEIEVMKNKSITKNLIEKSGVSTGEFLEGVFKPKLKIEGDRSEILISIDNNNILIKNGKRYYQNLDLEAFNQLSQLLLKRLGEKAITQMENKGSIKIKGVSKVDTFLHYNYEELENICDLELIGNIPMVKKVSGELIMDIYNKADKLEISLGIEGVSEDELEKIFEHASLGLDSVYLDEKRKFIIDSKQKKTFEELYRAGIVGDKTIISEVELMRLSLGDPSIRSPLKEKIKKLVGEENQNTPKLNAKLRDYQIKGYSWLKNRYDLGLGGVLADDMGLGKTLQTIALLTEIYKKEQKPPSLIVVPTSLLHNWKNEIKKFSPSLDIVLVEGGKKEREIKLSKKLDGKVLITTYGVFKNDVEEYKKLDLEVVILDEGQKIKNPNTLLTKAIKEIEGRVKFILSGTPVENNIYDLWSIFDFIMPNYLGNLKNFKRIYGKQISLYSEKSSLKSLKNITTPFILRRLKKDVLKELPGKLETEILIEMDKNQKKHYLSYLEKAKGEMTDLVKNKGFNSSRVEILSLLTRLRQICCSPELIIENYKGKSSKVEALIELLLEMKESEHRVLVFSQFTKIFEIIEEKLKKNKLTYFKLDGKTKSKDRISMSEAFNRGEKDLFLISLKAGGTGLNLVGADIVIHFDPWWNPAVENQASDRAHRMGQRKIVQVIKLIAEDSIEEKILEIQKEKKNLINAVIDGERRVEAMTEKDFNNILQIK